MIVEGKKEFSCWDIGGTLIYGGEQPSQFFACGSEFGVEIFLKNIPVIGVIWVVNISEDIDQLLLSKKLMFQVI